MLGFMLVLLGAALAAGLAGTGSAVGCGIVGMAASGVVSEDPNKFGRLLLLQALPGTQGIYGMVALFMIINKVVGWGVPLNQIPVTTGLEILAAALPVATHRTHLGHLPGQGLRRRVQPHGEAPERGRQGPRLRRGHRDLRGSRSPCHTPSPAAGHPAGLMS